MRERAVADSRIGMALNKDGRPDFLVIGAMKCGTTTLHEQLAQQPGVAMSRPKEPNFFSDEPEWARGLDWYASLFESMPAGSVRGESSTHYTKWPDYPDACERIRDALPDVKLVYLMRHPIERLVSHYWHEHLEGTFTEPIDEAIDRHSALVDFGRYSQQLKPYLDAFGPERIHLMALERLTARPQEEFAGLCEFLKVKEPAYWDDSLAPQNVGRERMRRSELRHAVINAPVLAGIRRQIVPRRWVDKIKGYWRVDQARPTLSSANIERLTNIFDADLALLNNQISGRLTCSSFEAAVTAEQNPLIWKPTQPH